MEMTRRNFCISGAGFALVPFATPAWGKPPPHAKGGKSTDDGSTDDGSTDTGSTDTEYQSTLVNGYTPSPNSWGGREWRTNMGSTWNEGMDHCFRVTQNRARFELRNSTVDHSSNDPDTTRRSEISGSLYGDPTRLPNNVTLWGALQFNHHSWSDPAGMAKLWGGVHGQIHMGKSLGGSPALAFRRNKRGELKITTRGEFNTSGTTRYEKPLSFDQVHDLVYRVKLHEVGGALTVWLDGQKIIDVFGVSIGSHHAECYWAVGCYYSGGITCPVVAEYGNHVYPGTKDLSARIASPPIWQG